MYPEYGKPAALSDAAFAVTMRDIRIPPMA